VLASWQQGVAPNRDPAIRGGARGGFLLFSSSTFSSLCQIENCGEKSGGWPVIALDEIRKRLHISPEGNQGLVIQTAKEQARAYLCQQQPFVWNVTNVTRALREQLVNFFVSYGACVRIVYLDAPLETIVRRNRNRAACVPEAVMNKLIHKLDMAEAHVVLWESI